MKPATMALLILAALLTAACQDATAPVRQQDPDGPFAPPKTGTLVVRVYWDDQGVPGKRVEVLELQLTGKTDDAGYATFELPAGAYTVRVYDINRGGPPMRYIDTPVTIIAGKEVLIEVFDCLPCV